MSLGAAVDVPNGVGLGLRGAFLDELYAGAADGRVAFFEVAPENYMNRGGRVPARLEAIADRFALISHGLMMNLGGTDPFEHGYFDELRAFLGRHDLRWHSDHVCFSGLDGALFHDLLPVPFNRPTARRIVDRVREAQDRLQRPMAIENISWYAQLGEPTMTEPEFLTTILEQADCALLLDVNNVFVNATNHGFDPYVWLARIPLERVVQLHVAGHENYEDGLLLDTHGADVRDEVVEMMAWVIERTGPKPVVLERDFDIPPLERLLDEVARLDRRYREAVLRWRVGANQPRAVSEARVRGAT